MPKIIIDQKKCNQCGACVALCNSGNVYVQEIDTVQVVNIENCWFCGHCVAHVPVEDSFGRDDATYAAYNLILAAQRMGLGSCLIGYFIYALENNDQLRKHVGLPQPPCRSCPGDWIP